MIAPVLALHGGAGATRTFDYGAEIEQMRTLVETAGQALRRGATALDVVVDVVATMEDSGYYVAGRGGSPALDGTYELDACVMDGIGRRAGAVAALQGFRNPSRIARAIIETPHVLLAGDGAARFAGKIGAEPIPPADEWFTHACGEESNNTSHIPQMGTVGCVARDGKGRLAAATSTAGLFGKMPGRVSDTPVVGAGTWADEHVAVSATGIGEYFIRSGAAMRVAFRVAAGERLADATARVLALIASDGGEGGFIAVGRDGSVSIPYSSEGMKRAALFADGSMHVDVFGDPQFGRSG